MKRKHTLISWTSIFVVLVLLIVPATPASAYGGAAPTAAKEESQTVYLGGFSFGMKFYTQGILIVGFSDRDTGSLAANPAFCAGLRQGDRILCVDGKELQKASDLADCVGSSGGQSMEVEYVRAGKRNSCRLTPKLSEQTGKYTSGLWVKDSGAGIGTVTYVVPQTLAFGGLGHGICSADSGELLPIRSGIVTGVTVTDVVRGQAGNPGEIKGYFNTGKIGSLNSNTDCGVFGFFFQKLPGVTKETAQTALRREVREGAATMRTTLADNEIGEYTVEISEIDRSAVGPKCFTVTVTDPRLLKESGGIVQGMSGSPILQNGKLIGAVTHVLINDPAVGYGIFIDNMLAQTPQALA